MVEVSKRKAPTKAILVLLAVALVALLVQLFPWTHTTELQMHSLQLKEHFSTISDSALEKSNETSSLSTTMQEQEDGFSYQAFDGTGNGEYPASVLVPSLSALKTKQTRIRNCTPRQDRILYFASRGPAGLTDRTGKILFMAALACRLQARVLVESPSVLLSVKHNFKKLVPEKRNGTNVVWDDYIQFPTFVFEKPQSVSLVDKQQEIQKPAWQRCPDRTVLQDAEEVKSARRQFESHHVTTIHQFEKLTHDMLVDALKNTNRSLFWKFNADMSYLPTFYLKRFQDIPDDLGQTCNAERVLGEGIIQLAERVKAQWLGGSNSKYLSIKLRRGDDIRNTRECTDPNLVAASALDIVQRRMPSFSSSDNRAVYLFVMMEPESAYQNQLKKALEGAFLGSLGPFKNHSLRVVFEQETPLLLGLQKHDNYIAYCVSYALSESAPLGRIEARRFEKWDKRYNDTHHCGLIYSKTQPLNERFQWRFLEAGFYAQFHQIYP